MSKKLFRVTNKAMSSRLIVAPSEEIALDIAMKGGHARVRSNLKIIDLTDEYSGYHSDEGFDVNALEDGFMCQEFCEGKSPRWVTSKPPGSRDNEN